MLDVAAWLADKPCRGRSALHEGTYYGSEIGRLGTGLGRTHQGCGEYGADGTPTAPWLGRPPRPPPPSGPQRVAVSAIHKSPWQPRRAFSMKQPWATLVASVSERGVLQPLLVRKVKSGYELIAGERRFRAAQAADLKDVPVVVLEVTDREALELALIENLQREDLNLIEEAEGYRALADKFNLTQDEIAARMGKARPTVANALGLLELPDMVKRMVAENQLSPGHAKALLGLAHEHEQEKMALRVLAEGLSVRQVEKLVAASARSPRARKVVKSDIPPEHVKYVLDRLHQKLGTAVHLSPSRTLANGRKVKGVMEIEYYSADDLDRIMVILGIAGDL